MINFYNFNQTCRANPVISTEHKDVIYITVAI